MLNSMIKIFYKYMSFMFVSHDFNTLWQRKNLVVFFLASALKCGKHILTQKSKLALFLINKNSYSLTKNR